MDDDERRDDECNPEGADSSPPAEEVRRAIRTDEFDFSDTDITQSEYGVILDELASLNGVADVKHSRILNEIGLFLSTDYTGTFSKALLPVDDLQIRHISIDAEDEETTVDISTTKLFCLDDEIDDYFPGTYLDEAMAYLGLELSLFDEVEDVSFIRTSDGEILVQADLIEGVTSTWPFHDLLVYLGYTINSAEFSNHSITRLTFSFSESRVWDAEAVESFQQDKRRWYQNRALENVSRELPCGHTATVTIGMFSGISSDDLYQSSPIEVGEFECHEIPVVSTDSVLYTVAGHAGDEDNADDEYVSVEICRGFCCDECAIYYAFSDEEKARQKTGESLELLPSVVEIGEEIYCFTVYPIPATSD